MAEWIDLVDPDESELRRVLPSEIHETALELLVRTTRRGDEPRPRLEGHDHYVFGVFLIPVAVREEDRVYYQEVDVVATQERVVTVRKTPSAAAHAISARRSNRSIWSAASRAGRSSTRSST